MAEAESVESKSIRELTAAVVASNTKRQEQLERIAGTTDHEGTTRAADARALIEREDEAIKQRANLAGISQRRLNKSTVLGTAIEDQKAIMEAQKKSLEEIGVDADTNKQFQKEQIKLAKMELAQAKSSGSSEAEDAAKEKLRAAKGNSLLGNMAKGIADMGKGALKTAAAKLPSMKALLMTGGLAAIMMFLKSPYFTKVKDFIEKEVLPILANLYDNILVPIGKIFKNFFVATWENIKVLFKDLGAAFDLFEKGEWWAGITKFFGGIATFLGKMIDTAATAVYNMIATIFGLEETDSVWGSIKKFFGGLLDDVINWITLTKLKITTTFTETFNSLFDWFKLLFSDPVEALKKLWDTLTEGYANIMDFIWSPVKAGIAWLLRLFGWDEAAAATEKFSIKDYIMKKFAAIKKWFTDLFAWTQSEEGQESWVVKTITGIVTGVKKWLGDLFKFDSASDIIASAFNVVTFLPNIILKGLKLVTGWLLGLFGFDEKAKKLANAEDWSIGGMITDALEGIIKWIGELFNFDFMGWIKEKAGALGKAGSWLLSAVGIGGDEKTTTTTTTKTGEEARKAIEQTKRELRERKAAARRRKEAEKLEILKEEASDKAELIAKGTGWHALGGAGGIKTTEKELANARKELEEMKAQIRALDAKASVNAIDASSVADNRKIVSVTHSSVRLDQSSSAGQLAKAR